MNRKEFKQLYDNMRGLFPKDDTTFTDDTVKLWYECLKDIDFRRANEGLLLYAKESKWIPSIAEIRKYANKIPKYTQEEISRMIEEAKEKEREQGDSFGF